MQLSIFFAKKLQKLVCLNRFSCLKESYIKISILAADNAKKFAPNFVGQKLSELRLNVVTRVPTGRECQKSVLRCTSLAQNVFFPFSLKTVLVFFSWCVQWACPDLPKKTTGFFKGKTPGFSANANTLIDCKKLLSSQFRSSIFISAGQFHHTT